MSAQQIKDITVDNIINELDNYLICEGKAFIKNYNFDLEIPIDYYKIDLLLKFKNIINCNNSKKISEIINKILKK